MKSQIPTSGLLRIVLSTMLLLVLVVITAGQTVSTMNWTAGPPLNLPRDSGAAVMTPDGTIYMLGGNTPAVTSVEALGPGAAGWQAVTPLTQGLIAPGATLFGAGSTMLAIVGGKPGNRAVRDLVSYMPGVGVTNLRKMNLARYTHATVLAQGYNLYCIGGKDDRERQTALVEVNYLPSGRWSAGPSLPEARSNFAAATPINSAGIFTFGGSTASQQFTDTVLRLNGASWSAMTPMPIATRDSAVVAGANNLLYVIGGTTAAGPTTAVQIYHVLTDTWTQGTPLPAPVSNASAVIDNSGRILVIGGVNATNSSVALVSQSAQESAPPVISAFPAGNALAGVTYSALISAAGNPAPTFALTTAPAGMTINSTTGVITWTPANTQIGVQPVAVRATNTAGTAEVSFAVTVQPPAPFGLAASNITANTATLTWNAVPANVSGATYNLYQRVCGGRSGCRASLVIGGLTVPTVNLGGLGAGIGYGYYVATAASGLVSPLSAPVFFGTLIPSAPTNVTIAAVAQNTVTLSWTAPATSQVPVVGYRIYEGGVVKLDHITGTTATIGGLLTNTAHIFYVVSLDANNNQSFIAVAPPVTTSSAPVIFHNPAFPRAVGGGFYAESLVGVIGEPLTLIAPEAQTAAGMNYVVSSLGMPAPTFSLVGAPSGMTIDGVSGIVSWPSVGGPTGTFTVTARGANNQGASEFSFSYTVYPAGTDLLSPTPVQNFAATATNITSTTATISWPASTDNVGVAGYRVFAVTPLLVCGTRVGCPPLPTVAPAAVTSGPATSATLGGLTPGTGYTFWIQAFDAAGNVSYITPGIQRTFVTLP